MTTPPPGERLVYALERIFEVRDLLAANWRNEFENKLIDQIAFDRCVELAGDTLPGRPSLHVLADSLRHLYDTVFDRKTIFMTAWRLAGNPYRLREGQPVGQWLHQPYNEWVPAQVSCVRRCLAGGRHPRPGALVTLRVQAGWPTGQIFERWWSLKYGRMLARELGFNWKERLFQDMQQFTTLRLLLLVEKGAHPKNVNFRFVGKAPALLAGNREQLRYRARETPTYACPHGKPDTLPCHFCPVGYLRCRAGTHLRDYTVKHCSRCNREAYFDSAEPDLCVLCSSKERYTR